MLLPQHVGVAAPGAREGRGWGGGEMGRGGRERVGLRVEGVGFRVWGLGFREMGRGGRERVRETGRAGGKKEGERLQREWARDEGRCKRELGLDRLDRNARCTC